MKRYSKCGASQGITRRMLWIALPVAVSSYVRSALSTIEHTMIPKGLKKHGSDADTALSSYGIVHGMVMPLIFFPSAVLQAFSSLLIPEVTRYHKRGDTNKINALIEKSLYTTLVFSIGASGIMFFFAEEIGMAVYKSPEAAYFLKMIAPLAAVMYADGVVDAVLKGLNQQVYSMGYNIADSAIAIVLMMFLLPAKGIDGYIIIIYVTEMVNAFLSINRLLHVSDFKIHPLKWTVLPFYRHFYVGLFCKKFWRSSDKHRSNHRNDLLGCRNLCNIHVGCFPPGALKKHWLQNASPYDKINHMRRRFLWQIAGQKNNRRQLNRTIKICCCQQPQAVEKPLCLWAELLARLTDRTAPIAADRLLVVTFTNAAAAEMRERIISALTALAEENPEDPFLANQLLLIKKAQITTIDSFCIDLLRRNFVAAKPPAGFPHCRSHGKRGDAR